MADAEGDEGSHEDEGEDEDDAMDDVVSVGTASTQEDGESSVETGSKGENAEGGESSCDDKSDEIPGGYDGPDPPMPVTGFSSRDHFREQCDNQLGCYSSSDSEPASEPDQSPSLSPSPAAPVEPMTREEKIRSFWKKYAVARSKHMEVSVSPPKPPSKPMPLPSAPVAPPHESVVSAGSVPGLTSHVNSDSDHLDSDTWRLSDPERMALMKQRALDDESSESDTSSSGSDMSMSVKSAVKQESFDQAMSAGSGSVPAHQKRLSSSSSKSTLETPHCSRPESCLCLLGGG